MVFWCFQEVERGCTGNEWFNRTKILSIDSAWSVQIRSNFWSVFSCIWTECGEIRSISPYSVRTQENTDQKLLRIWTLFTQCDELINLALIWSKFLKDQLLEINSFSTNVPFMQKPGCWFLLAKCLKST